MFPSFSCSVRLVGIWDKFFSSNYFPKIFLIFFAAISKFLNNSIYKIVTSIQGRSSVSGSRFWKHPFQIAIIQSFLRLSMRPHSFCFWNEIESLSMAPCSCRKFKVNLLTIILHMSNNLSSASVFKLRWWRGWLFCKFCQNPWKTHVKVIIFSKFAPQFGYSVTKNELL